MKSVASALFVTTLALVRPTSAAEAPQNFVMHDEPKALAEITFSDRDGATMRLADFRGKVVLLNVWATWCGPCRKEMPTLDRLQSELGGPEFEVVALSIDRAGVDVVNEFYGEIGIEHLAVYIDDSSAAMRQLGIVGVPSTLLIDREGRELGQLVGPAEWDAPEMLAFIREFVGPPEKGAGQCPRARPKPLNPRSRRIGCTRSATISVAGAASSRLPQLRLLPRSR